MNLATKYALDIGSSTIKLLAKSSDGAQRSRDYPSYLAAHLCQGRISDEGIARFCGSLSLALAHISPHERAQIACVGTAALRSAQNSALLCAILKEKFHINCRVISQEEEAALALKAARHFSRAACCALLDIGGASTELSGFDGSVQMFDYGLLNLCAAHVAPPKNPPFSACDFGVVCCSKEDEQFFQISPEFSALFCAAKYAFSQLAAPSRRILCTSKALIYSQTKAPNYEINEYDFADIFVPKSALIALAKDILNASSEELFWRFDAQNERERVSKSVRTRAIFSACAILCALDFEGYFCCPYSLKDALLLE